MSASAHFLDEKNNYKIQFTLVDAETGSRIQLTSIGTMYCTQFYYNPTNLTSDPKHLATINGRYNQNVKNANNVAITTSGTVTWSVQPEDTTMLSGREKELHIAVFLWQYGGKQNSHAFYNYIRSIPYIDEMP